MASIYELIIERSCLTPSEDFTVEEHLMDIPACADRGSVSGSVNYIFTPTDELTGIIDNNVMEGEVAILDEMTGVISTTEMTGTINDDEVVGEIINEEIQGDADC